MKQTINVFEILGEKKDTQLDVSKIMSGQNDDVKLDVAKILSEKAKQNQEQQIAPDFDLYQSKPAPMPAPKPEPAPAPKPVEKPAPAVSAPKPVEKPEPEPIVAAEPIPEPEPEPDPMPTPPVKAEPPTKPAPEPKPAPMPAPMPEPAPAPVVKQEPTPASKPEPAPAPKRRVSMLRLIIKIAVFAAIITVLQMFVIGFPKVSMNSMDPLISSGDRVAVSKMATKFTKGDVIVFKGDNGKNLAARIVAVKGDVVSLNNVGGLYVNNDLQTEEYIHTVTVITDTAVSYPVIVEDDSYFVLGDNRTDSIDSRNSDVGQVEKDSIIGKVIFCFKTIK